MNLIEFIRQTHPDAQGWSVRENPQTGESEIVGWDESRNGPLPTTAEREAWQAQQIADAQARQQAQTQRANRLQEDHGEADSFAALDASWSTLNLAQANVVLRRLVRFAARLDRRLRDLES